MSRKNIVEMSTKIPPGMTDWLDSIVLGCVTVADREYCENFKRYHRIFGNREDEGDYELVAPDSEKRVSFPPLNQAERPFFYAYDCFFTKLGITIPFTEFETEILWNCNLAPTQLHPNSWAFMKIFQLLCQELGVRPSLCLFLYLFVLTKVGTAKKKASWISFRATQGRKVFSIFNDSFHDFKNFYFKVRAVDEVHPFFLDKNKEPTFPLWWQENPVVLKYSLESLDKVERAFVGVLEEHWGEPPHLDTKKFLGDPTLLRSELEMASGSDSMKVLRKTKKTVAAQNLQRKTSGEGSSQVPPKKLGSGPQGPRKNIPTPQVRVAPTDPPLASSGAASSPSSAGPSPKRQRTSGAYDLNDKNFDGVAFAEEHIAPYGYVPTDDVSIRKHLDFISSTSVRMANLSAALSRKFKKSPVNTTSASLENAKTKLERAEGLRLELEAKNIGLELSLEKEKARATEAEAVANLARENYIQTYGELLRVKKKLQSSYYDYAELQEHIANGMTALYENLKAQVRVLAPHADLSLFSMNNIVEDGKIVPAPNEDETSAPNPKAKTSGAPSAETTRPEADPDVEILNGPDGVVGTVPISVIPTVPQDAAMGAKLDPL
ncbi:uncharacterized protein LOC130976285 [Arachis stenosperma]|uniref:uncharacterized protein LOC130976285 n=1 Tax=Arachis stenosperma TaxID=217475 RepID=UPI0025AC2EF7|nr:uncharacterized protein LOC130976285 [Arachis stenosperma]